MPTSAHPAALLAIQGFSIKKGGGVFKDKFNQIILRFDDVKLEEVMKHIGRLGNVSLVFLGAIGLLKYPSSIFPVFPVASIVMGILGLFITFMLLVAVAIGGWKALYTAIPNDPFGHLLGAAFFVFTLLLGLGGIFVAVNA